MPELIEMSGQPHRTSPTLATLGFFTGVSGRASKTLLTSEVFHPWRLLSYTMSQTGRKPPQKPGVLEYGYHPSTQMAEAGGSRLA